MILCFAKYLISSLLLCHKLQSALDCVQSAFNFRSEPYQQQNVWSASSMLIVHHIFCRDGGLKRGKVKDTFKEEQQKLYSKMLVGTQEDRSRSWRAFVEVDQLRLATKHLWLNGQSAVDPHCQRSWSGKFSHWCQQFSTWFLRSLLQPGLLCCIAVMGSAAPCWSSLTEALLALETKRRRAHRKSSSVAVVREQLYVQLQMRPVFVW